MLRTAATNLACFLVLFTLTAACVAIVHAVNPPHHAKPSTGYVDPSYDPQQPNGPLQLGP